MKSSQSNFNLRSPGSFLARSYLIATVCHVMLTAAFFIDFVQNNHLTQMRSNNDGHKVRTPHPIFQFKLTVKTWVL